MRGVAVVLIVAGCDGIWDLEHIPSVDASAAPAGLVAWFPMESAADRKVIEVVGGGDGVCLVDQCPQVTAGRVDNALVFDGASQLLNAPTPGALATKGSFTVAVWVRLTRQPPRSRARSTSSTSAVRPTTRGSSAWPTACGASMRLRSW